jgi:predicted ATP-grasp superfamily ATP-dependent carboligase
MSFASRYSRGHFLYPSPFHDQHGFIERLKEWADSHKDCVIIPVFEETFLIAKHQEELSSYTRMVVPSYDQILTAHNKDRWEPIARNLGIPVPETYTVEEVRARSKLFKGLGYPLLIKPKQGGGAWAIKQINSKEELLDLVNRDMYYERPWDIFFFQKRIEGETHCVAMLFNQGKLRAQVTYRQLRDYPVTGGQATLRISMRNPDAESYFERLLHELNWHGVCQADFIVEKETGISYLIDINPRFWGSLAQGIASGVDFPYLLYGIAVNGDVEAVETFRTGVVTRWLGGDLRAFIPMLINSPDKLSFLLQYFFPKNKSKLYDDFAWSDPLPFCAWCFDALYKAIRHRSFTPMVHDSLDGIWE